MTTTQASAIAAAAQVLAATGIVRDEDIARSGGPEAVGQWAADAPGEDPAGTAAHYQRLWEHARKAAAA